MDYRKQAIKDGKEAMDKVSDVFNNLNSHGQEAFIEQFNKEHRTLQQGMLGGFFKIMVQCAERYEKGHYDARNEASLKACKDMVDAYNEKYGYLPSVAFPLV